MPKVSERQQCLKWIRKELNLSILMESSSDDGMSSSDSDDSHSDTGAMHDTSDSDMELFFSSDSDVGDTNPAEWLELYGVVESQRYLVPKTKRIQSKEFADFFFRYQLPADHFRQICRMDKESFFTLVNRIEMHPVFSNKSFHDQAAVALQLACTLDRLGHNGNKICIKRVLLQWGISVGSTVNYTRRCITALEDVLDCELSWPDRHERQLIATEFAKKGFPGCVGLIDGTTLPLTQRPASHGECYYDRKSRYSVNAQIVCDHRQKIIFLYTGMPGSFQDIKCLKRSILWNKINDNLAFDEDQYLLGDSGYINAPHMVAAYKATCNLGDKEDFNICVAKTRYVNEHCIGILKSRWFSLKEVRIQLNAKKDNVWLCRWVRACALLHNFVMSQDDEWRERDMEEALERVDQDEAGIETSTEATVAQNVASREVGRALQQRIMAHTLSFNRQPGGFLHVD